MILTECTWSSLGTARAKTHLEVKFEDEHNRHTCRNCKIHISWATSTELLMFLFTVTLNHEAYQPCITTIHPFHVPQIFNSKGFCMELLYGTPWRLRLSLSCNLDIYLPMKVSAFYSRFLKSKLYHLSLKQWYN